MTGAPVPFGADSVIRIEDTDGGLDVVAIRDDRDALRNVRPRGEDIAEGDVAVAAGTVLSPGRIGFLASTGCREVRATPRPRVAVLASGAELVDLDEFDQVRAGRRIVSSNSYSLEAAIREAGGEPVMLGLVGDDRAALARRISEALERCDMLVTTGGVSVGAFDFTRDAARDAGFAMRFWRVRIRPGAPMGFGMRGRVPWLGLPGNPVSALVTFELFARPAIRRLLGRQRVYRDPVTVHLDEALELRAPLTHLFRVTVRREGDALAARLTGAQGSGLLSSMARADALLLVSSETRRLAAGDTALAILLGDDTAHTHVPPPS